MRTPPKDPIRLTRRDVLGGALMVSIAVAAPSHAGAQATPRPQVPPDQLDSYIAIGADGGVTAFFGKIDCGQGLDVAIAQIVAEELDLRPDRVAVVMGDTGLTVNQGGASNASGVAQGSIPLRNAAAEARLILLELAAEQLGAPIGELSVKDGVFSARGRSRHYGELIGSRRFDVALKWNGQYGNALNVEGRATPKQVADYTVIGTPQPRRDIAAKVFAQHDYVTDIHVPGMLHARMIRPPVAGAVPVRIDEASLAGIDGTRIVHKAGFLAVVADREWDAIRAMRALKVEWTAIPPPFPDQATLFNHIRQAPVTKRAAPMQIGDPAAMAGAARTITAEYEWPFQSHASMGPGCAVADVRDGTATLWTGTQKPHFARDGVAKLLGLPPDDVRGIWETGPGSYGRNDAGDAAIDAAILSRELGRPVRVQYMRDDATAWDAKSPASVHRLRAGVDAQGRIVALEMTSKAFSRTDVATSEADPRDSLASQFMGGPLNHTDTYLFPGDFVPLSPYAVASKRMEWEVIPPLLDRASPLRTSHLRDPLGPELIFASDCFIDELAASTGSDPLEFRLRHLEDPRDVEMLQTVAAKAGWQSRPAGPRDPSTADIVIGRGVSLSHRDATVVGLVVEIEVNRRTGHVRVKRMVAGHDCGLIVNPDGVHRCVENALVYAISRATCEEVTFSRKEVTSVDWITYPVLDIIDTPDQVEIVLINRPALKPTGAGEPAVRSVAAAIGNAIFDATGIRIRRGPFTDGRVRALLTQT